MPRSGASSRYRSLPPRLPAMTRWVVLLALPLSAAALEAVCHPDVHEDQPQYIIGYGSLMETASKQRTSPNTGENLPVLVTGYQRKWNAKGSPIGFSTTYLGVQPHDGAEMVAALYRVFDAQDIHKTDEREAFYCREAVDQGQIRMLDGTTPPAKGKGQIWIYVNKPESIQPPSEHFPIVESYVDIFLTGCFELQEKVLVKDFNFAEHCIETTKEWSRHWVNDRLYPRRPFIYQPNASRIDELLKRKLPELFDQIRIE